jgi:hypothetical protein
MKIKLLAIFIIPCLLFSLVSCANSSKTATSSAYNGQAKAYYTVFLELYKEDSALNDGKYLAVDLSKVKSTDTAPFLELMQDFCKDHGYTLLQGTSEELEAKGYIKNLSFKDGFLISFKDEELTQKKLVTSASKWRSGIGSIGAEYTVEKKETSWKIEDTENCYIS